MKVLHVITGLGDGGAEAVLYRLCQFDSKNEHIVVSLSSKGKYGVLLENIGVEVFSLHLYGIKSLPSSLYDLFKLIKKQKPNAIQTWMFHGDLLGGIVGRLAGVKNVIWGVHHTNLIKGQSKFSTILVAKLNTFLSNFVPKAIVYCANKSKEVQELNGYVKDKGVVITNGYDTNYFDVSDVSRFVFRAELGVTPDAFIIGHVGRFDPLKDYPNLIESVSLVNKVISNYYVVLIGTNLDCGNSELASLISRYKLEERIILLGRRDDICSAMNGFDVLVLSSVSEAFPNVLNEAMACGAPCITTDVGDAAYIVGESGWIVPSKNPVSLANSIIEAFNEYSTNYPAWSRRQEISRARINNSFGIEKMINSYNEIWNR
tara:strand:+ start:2472 stop:3593 length:1122 start_codon:yes stop_codon:yes gene_type:complete